MIKDPNDPGKIRFTKPEVAEAAEHGLDLQNVKTTDDLRKAEEALIQSIPEDAEGLELMNRLLEIAKQDDPEQVARLEAEADAELRKSQPTLYMQVIKGKKPD